MGEFLRNIISIIVIIVFLFGMEELRNKNSNAIEALNYDKRVEHLDKKDFEIYKYRNNKYLITADGKVYETRYIGRGLK